MTEQTTAETTENPCECSLWETGAEYETDGQPDMDITTTGCEGEPTRKVFAPGHDAKLKSLMILAGVNDWEMRYGRSTGMLHSMSWDQAASKFGFYGQVSDGVERGRAKAQARREAEAVKLVEDSRKDEATIAAKATETAKLTAHQGAIIAHVRDYAAKHITVAGWELVNDKSFTDLEILQIIGRVQGEKAKDNAVRKMRAHLTKLTRTEAR